jgi:hypothetical protein
MLLLRVTGVKLLWTDSVSKLLRSIEIGHVFEVQGESSTCHRTVVEKLLGVAS